ncbi:hypothetical protein TNCV_780241 [Trichonephila clavipes]|nr:hypothetical protein TNCV_780241 [Trichonephila clavipes]
MSSDALSSYPNLTDSEIYRSHQANKSLPYFVTIVEIKYISMWFPAVQFEGKIPEKKAQFPHSEDNKSHIIHLPFFRNHVDSGNH